MEIVLSKTIFEYSLFPILRFEEWGHVKPTSSHLAIRGKTKFEIDFEEAKKIDSSHYVQYGHDIKNGNLNECIKLDQDTLLYFSSKIDEKDEVAFTHSIQRFLGILLTEEIFISDKQSSTWLEVVKNLKEYDISFSSMDGSLSDGKHKVYFGFGKNGYGLTSRPLNSFLSKMDLLQMHTEMGEQQKLAEKISQYIKKQRIKLITKTTS